MACARGHHVKLGRAVLSMCGRKLSKVATEPLSVQMVGFRTMKKQTIMGKHSKRISCGAGASEGGGSIMRSWGKERGVCMVHSEKLRGLSQNVGNIRPSCRKTHSPCAGAMPLCWGQGWHSDNVFATGSEARRVPHSR